MGTALILNISEEKYTDVERRNVLIPVDDFLTLCHYFDATHEASVFFEKMGAALTQPHIDIGLNQGKDH